MAVATCLLEHLLEFQFDLYFPRLEREVRSGNRLLADTFMTCWKFDLAEVPRIVKRWERLE